MLAGPFVGQNCSSTGVQACDADNFVLPPPGHRFPMAKYQLLRDRVVNDLPEVRMAQALPASDGELALAHSLEF